MEKSTVMKALVPSLAGAALLALLAFLIMGPNPNEAPAPRKSDGTSASSSRIPDDQKTKDESTDNMPKELPSIAEPGFVEIQGMKYLDVVVGEGKACPAGADISCHYAGWLMNGKKFDSSYLGRSSPAQFNLGGLIKGWQIGIVGMKPGGVRRFVIPSELGYGAGGSPPTIPPNSTLVFEMKLLSWN